MAIKDYAKKVAGKKKNDIFLFTLSTCVWCKKTKKLLKELGLEYSYIDLDLMKHEIEEEVIKAIEHWNPKQSFPTIVINNKKSIIGFQEDEIMELGK